MSARTTGRYFAAAGSGLIAGITGVFVYNRNQDASKESSSNNSTSRSLPLPSLQGASVKEDPPIASDFVMPFVKRYGLPDLDQVILPSEEFTTCWDSRTRNARWVVERIDRDTIDGPGDRAKAYFRADPRLERLFRSELSDFRKSGFDRGHLAPAGDHKTTQENLKETFLLTNMSPQEPSFNRGYWSDFEEFVRTLVVPDKDGQSGEEAVGEGPPFKDLYVITGPLYLPSREDLPAGGSGSIEGGSVVDVDDDADEEGVVDVLSSDPDPDADADTATSKWVLKHDIIGNPMRMVAVPTHFFKVIIAEPFPPSDTSEGETPKTYVAAFAMPNVDIPNNYDLRNFLVPLEALESVAGMRFLSATSSKIGGLDRSTREFLDGEAVRVRMAAGVAPLTADWVNRTDNGYRRLEAGEAPTVDDSERRLYRHLCTVTSCQGV